MITANAQDVGKMWIGGSVGLSSSKVKGADASTSYRVLPEFGYMLSENMGLGISLGYAHSEGYSEAFDRSGKINAFVVNPFVRYNFLRGDIGGLFVDGGIEYAQSKMKDVDTKINMYGAGFRPGASINISNCVTFIGKFGLLGYQHTKMGEGKTDWYGFDLSLDNVEFGINFVF